MCSFHQSAMRITGGKTLILQHQDSRTKIKQRKKCTFLRFFISFGLLLPISYRGMVAILCYPTLPTQVFFERQGEGGKSLWTPLQFALITYPSIGHQSVIMLLVIEQITSCHLRFSCCILFFVRSRSSPLHHRQTRNKLLNHQIKQVQDLMTNLD